MPSINGMTAVTALKLSRRHRLYENSGAFLYRLLVLVYEPRHFAPLVADYWMLIQSIWTGKELGPDLVYPMLSTRKRQSGRLARFVLEHCRVGRRYERYATTSFPEGIDPPCVAVIDLGEAPRDEYSTHVDLYGFVFMLMISETVMTVIVHVHFLSNLGWVAWMNWIYCAIFNLVHSSISVSHGDGTLTLAQRTDTSTPACAVLLDQDFTVIIKGSQSSIEAIAEGSFSLSHRNSIWRSAVGHGQESSFSSDLLEALCEVICLTVFVLWWLLVLPMTTIKAPTMAVVVIATLLQRTPGHLSLSQKAFFVASRFIIRIIFPIILLIVYEQYRIPLLSAWAHLLPDLLILLFLAGYKARDYPIRSTKFFDALGHPKVRKWQFDTLATAATFQCLVICQDIPRPIKSIDVLALLDILVPDQRDVWTAWKERVADRVVHEDMDIWFAPTIPTFGDERQQQLKDLLDQAQFGDDVYRCFYGRRWANPQLD